MGYVARWIRHRAEVAVERKFRPQLAEADKFVRDFYGLEPKPLPELRLENRDDAASYRKEKNWLRRLISPALMNYEYDDQEAVVVKVLYAFVGMRCEVEKMVHEMVHHYQNGLLFGNVPGINWDLATQQEEAMVCAAEGLASIADEKYTPPTEPTTAERCLLYVRDLIHPFIMGILLGVLILPGIIVVIHKGLREKVKRFINKGNRRIPGEKFAMAVMKQLGNDPKQTFRAICNNPPVSTREIENPDEYLIRVRGTA